jgi:hypothetical protein
MKSHLVAGSISIVMLLCAAWITWTKVQNEDYGVSINITDIPINVPKPLMDAAARYQVFYLVTTQSCPLCVIEIEQVDSLLREVDFRDPAIISRGIIVVDTSLTAADRFRRIGRFKPSHWSAPPDFVLEVAKLDQKGLSLKRLIVVDSQRSTVVWSAPLGNRVTPLGAKRGWLAALHEELRGEQVTGQGNAPNN